MDNPECFSCGASTSGGLKILGQYLCENCETSLVKCQTDKFEYQHWIDSCHRFWEKLNRKITGFEEEAE
ncbi:MAG: hypothetical protein GXY86_05090 [Firmicutes bacterium]|mgnify:CR=1 FL=1|nr:hypothetical protein [Bacillota bacterium]